MPVLISGILRDGAGTPVQNCIIQLKAKKTSPTVVVGGISSTLTDTNGHYSIEAALFRQNTSQPLPFIRKSLPYQLLKSGVTGPDNFMRYPSHQS